MAHKKPPNKIALLLGDRSPGSFIAEGIGMYITEVNVDDDIDADEFAVYVRDDNEDLEGMICVLEPSGDTHGVFNIWQVAKDSTK